MSGATIDRYRTMIRQPTYALWSGKIGAGDFNAMMIDAVEAGLKGAWLAGARAAGILPDEMTDREISQMQTDVFNQFQYIPGFAEFIQRGSKANGGKLESLLPRMNLWVSRYKEFYERGMLMAKRDQKQEWFLGATEKHCGSCVKLSGKVKRSSSWIEADIYPMSPRLECKGYQCACELKPTDKPCSKGRLPSLP